MKKRSVLIAALALCLVLPLIAEAQERGRGGGGGGARGGGGGGRAAISVQPAPRARRASRGLAVPSSVVLSAQRIALRSERALQGATQQMHASAARSR